MKILLTALLLIIANNSIADGLYTGAWSHHFVKDEWEAKGWDMNENHKLIAYQYKKIITGHYYNSFGQSTVLLNVEIASYQFYDIKTTLYGGFTYGYSFCDGDKPKTYTDPKKACPDLMPEFKYTKYKLQPALLIIGFGVAGSLYWDFD